MGRFDKKSVAARKAGSKGGEQDREIPPGNVRQVQDNPELIRIGAWLSKVSFRKKLIGGVDPEDVWKKMEELNALYEDALTAERIRYNWMLRQQNRNERQMPDLERDSDG